MFKLVSSPIDTSQCHHSLSDTSAGALASFIGLVRNHNQKKNVIKLEYSAYDELCSHEAAIILEEAKQTYPLIAVSAVHRLGVLKPGDVAIWVGVLSAHRKEAFLACSFLVDEFKKRLPIWKKEYYTDETPVWVNAQTSSPPIQPEKYYEKQILLSEIRSSGQNQLRQSKVLVVGAGGLGSAVLQGLTGSGIGTIGIVEHDTLEESNLHRQHLYRHQDIGQSKAHQAKSFCQALNPSIQIKLYPTKISSFNIAEIALPYDLILDCTDNFETKYLLNDWCVQHQKSLVSASLYQWEGQIYSFHPTYPSCLRCLWPQTPPQDCVGTCTQAGILGSSSAAFGHLQVLEAVKLILQIHSPIPEIMLYNFKSHRQNKIKLMTQPHCKACRARAEQNINMNHLNLDTPDPYTTNISSIPQDQLTKYVYLDIREPEECHMNPVENWPTTQLPLSQWPDPSFEFKQDQHYMIFCAKGIRSYNFVEHLHEEENIKNVISLEGGIESIQRAQKNGIVFHAL